MRVSTKLTLVYVTIVAVVLGCSSFIFLRSVDSLAVLLRSSFSDALLPLKAIQDYEVAFDQLESDEREFVRPPFTDLDRKWAKLQAVRVDAEKKQQVLEQLLLKSDSDRRERSGGVQTMGEDWRRQEMQDVVEIRADLQNLRADLEQTFALLQHGQLDQAQTWHHTKSMPAFRHIQTRTDDLRHMRLGEGEHLQQRSEATLAATHRGILTLTLLISAAGIGVLLLITTRLLSPLGRLKEATQQIAAGDLDHEIAMHRHDEFGDVAYSFNQMMRALRSAHEQLERRVEERTAELASSNDGLRREIIERARAELQLRTSEERYRMLFENSTDAIATVDEAGSIMEHNPAFLELFGYSAADIRTLNASQYWEDPGSRIAAKKKARSQGFLKDYEAKMMHKGGAIFDVSMTTTPYRAPGQNEVIFQSIYRDVTERNRAAESLRQFAAMQGAILNSAPYGVITTSAEGIIATFNRAAEEMLGYKAAEVIGTETTFVLVDPEEVAMRARLLATELGVPPETGFSIFRSKMLTGKPYQKEWTFIRKDGSRFPASLSLTAIQDESGKILGFMGVAIDISERKRAEMELLHAKEAAEAASRAKSEFLANMSHEIRTPMNGIIGMTDLALASELTREQREYLQLSRSSADALLQVINSILDFSKIEAGQMELEPITFDVRACLGDTIAAFGARAGEKGLELALDIAPDVPRRLIGDAGRLRQILVNLIGNAVKFTLHGEVVVRASLESQTPESAFLLFEVSDTGIGIAPENHKVIFESFQQADGSTTREFGGSGLGLAICNQLIRLMGGEIWLESEAGKGSRFFFTAQLRQVAEASEALEPLSLAELANVAVLVVDDSTTNSRILERVLSSWGMLPALAGNGPEALQMMQEAYQSGTAFPLVLLDFQMPQMDGFAVAERIKKTERFAAATIMMLTSGGKRGDAARCRELGVAAYLTKPIRQSELLDAVRLALGKKPDQEAPLITRHTIRERRRPLQVLVAEDNLVNQMLVVTLLMKAGHEVALVGNGVEAVAAWKSQPFDVIMMDVQMPEMDGFEAVAQIRKQEIESGAHIPIIAMTAHALVGDRERCLAAGMDSYISKPLDPQRLLDSIDAAVARSGNNDVSARAPEPAPPPLFVEPSSLSVIDEVLLDKLMGGDTALLRDLVRIYNETGPGLLEQIDSAIAQADAKRLRNAAHALKGAVSNFAAVSTLQACAALEAIGASGNLAAAASARSVLGQCLYAFHAKLASVVAAETAQA